MGNSATNKVIDEGTIQFRSHDRCITTLQGVRHVPKSKNNPIFLGALQEEGFNFNSEGDLMKVFKDTHVKFQAESVSNVYILRNSEVTVSGLQLSLASRSKVVEQLKTMIVLSFDIQFYLEGKLGLAAASNNKKFQIITDVQEQILINPTWIKEIIG